MGCDQTKKVPKKKHIYDEYNRSVDSFTSCDDISDNENIKNRRIKNKTKSSFRLKNRKKFNVNKDIDNKVIQGSLNIANFLINNIIEKDENERKLPDCNILYSLNIFTEFREKKGFELNNQFNDCDKLNKIAFKRYVSDYKKFIKMKNNKIKNQFIAKNLNSSNESSEKNQKYNERKGLSTDRIKTNINNYSNYNKNYDNSEENSSYISKKNRYRNYTMINNQKKLDNSADKYNNIIEKKKKLFLLDDNPYMTDLKMKNNRQEEIDNMYNYNVSEFKEKTYDENTKFKGLNLLKNNKEVNNNDYNNKTKIPQIKNKKQYSKESEIVSKPINNLSYQTNNYQNNHSNKKFDYNDSYSPKNSKKNYITRKNNDLAIVGNKTPKSSKSNNKINKSIQRKYFYVNCKTPNKITKNNDFSIVDKIDSNANNTCNNINTNNIKLESEFKKSKINYKNNINNYMDNTLKDYLDKEISIIKQNPKHVKKNEQSRYSNNSSNNSNNLNSENTSSYKIYSNNNSSSNNIITKSENSLLNKLKILKKNNYNDINKEPTNIKIDLGPTLSTLQKKYKNTNV